MSLRRVVLGLAIWQLCLKRGVTQVDLTRAAGLTGRIISFIERGERNLTLRSVERIAKRLGLQPLSLLSPEDQDSDLRG